MPTWMQSRRLLIAAATVAVFVTAGLWWSGTGTAGVRLNKPVTIVVTFPAGGGTDVLARKLGAAWQERTGQLVVVENRSGASGNIGAHAVAQAPGDGSTLLMVNSSFAINPSVYAQLDFDPRQDFKAVVNVGTIASVLIVPNTSPLESLRDAVQQANGSTGQSQTRSGTSSPALAYASCGNGTPQHLAGEMLAQATHTQWLHVPYKGCGPAVAAVAADQVPLAVVTLSSAAPLLVAGKVRAIAVTAPQRVTQWPDVPTVAEQGVAEFAVEQWHGLLAPASMPEGLRMQLHAVLSNVLAEPAMAQTLHALGYTPAHQTAAGFDSTIAADMDRYREVAQGLHLKVD